MCWMKYHNLSYYAFARDNQPGLGKKIKDWIEPLDGKVRLNRSLMHRLQKYYYIDLKKDNPNNIASRSSA